MSEKKNNTVLDPDMLAEALKVQTKDTIELILENAVKSYLKEAAGDDDLEDDAEKADPTEPEMDEPTVDEVPGDDAVADAEEAPAEEPVEVGDTEEPAEEEGDEWSNFDDYKVGDGEYDMTGVDDPTQLAKVWKLMGDEDDVVITQQDGKVELKDNGTGAEYLIDLKGDEPEAAKTEEGDEPVFEITFNKKPIMKEENIGYTDNYQDKDVVVGKEPYDAATPNKTNNWDAGAPDSKEKPWAGPSKEKGKPYAGEVNEEEGDLFEISFDECGGMPVDGPMEEGADTMSTQPTAKTTKSQGHHYGGDEPSRDVAKVDSRQGELKEDIQKKLEKIEEENKVLKSSLVKFRKALNEAVLTNYNIGNVVKLVFENATSKQEKYDILKRFSNEAKTKEQSQALYESINKQLKSVKKSSVAIDKPMNINESAVKNINESTIYKNDDEAINYALDMIQRMNNL
jgi:hypothetical protein